MADKSPAFPPSGARMLGRGTTEFRNYPPTDLEKFRDETDRAWAEYERCRSSENILGLLGKGQDRIETKDSKASGKAPIRVNTAKLVVDIFGALASECAESRFVRDLDPVKIIDREAEIWGKMRGDPAQAEEFAKLHIREFLKKEAADAFNLYGPDQQARYVNSVAQLLVRSLKFTDDELAELQKEAKKEVVRVDELEKGLEEVKAAVAEFEEYRSKAVGLAGKTANSAAGFTHHLAGGIAKLSTGQQLLLRNEFERLSGEEQLQWLESRAIDFSEDEKVEKRIKADRKAREEELRNTAETFDAAAEKVDLAAGALGRLGLLKPDQVKKLKRATQVFQAGNAAYLALSLSNPLSAATALAGLMGGGADPDAARHKEIMAALARIEKALREISAKLDRIEWQIQENQAAVLLELTNADAYLRIIHQGLQELSLRGAERIHALCKRIESHEHADQFAGTFRNSKDTVGDMFDVTNQNLKGVPPTPQAVWLTFDPSGSGAAPAALLRCWKNGVLALHALGFGLESRGGETRFDELLPYLARPDLWIGEGDRLSANNPASHTSFLARGGFVDCPYLYARMADFAFLLQHEPFLSRPEMFDQALQQPTPADLAETYARDLEVLHGMRKLIEFAMVQEALVVGSSLAPKQAGHLFRPDKNSPTRLSLLRILERAYSQDHEGITALLQKVLGVGGDKNRLKLLVDFATGQEDPEATPDPVERAIAAGTAEVLLQRLADNLGRWLVREICGEQADGSSLGALAYAIAWEAGNDRIGSRTSMEILFSQLAGWRGIALPVRRELEASNIDWISRHSLALRFDGTDWWIVRRIEFLRRAFPSELDSVVIDRRVVRLPHPASLLIPGEVPLTDFGPITGDSWTALAALRDRVGELIAGVTFALKFPASARALAKLHVPLQPSESAESSP